MARIVGSPTRSWDLDVSVDIIETTVAPEMEPDPEWRSKCKCGTIHRGDRLDFTTKVKTRSWWCEVCEEEHQRVKRVCRKCKRRVVPGLRLVAGTVHRSFIPGLRSGTLTVRRQPYDRLDLMSVLDRRTLWVGVASPDEDLASILITERWNLSASTIDALGAHLRKNPDDASSPNFDPRRFLDIGDVIIDTMVEHSPG